MKVPQNIIFDLGGVLLNIDYAKTEKAFKQLGFVHFTKMYNQFNANQLFENLETGKVNIDRFFEELISVSGNKVKPEEIETAWNAMLLDFRLPSLAFLEKLAENHRLFLLSNTNEIHHTAFMKIYSKFHPGHLISFLLRLIILTK